MMKDTSQRIRDLKEIAIVIDTWDDVFSDFDPRPLSERTVSGVFALKENEISRALWGYFSFSEILQMVYLYGIFKCKSFYKDSL